MSWVLREATESICPFHPFFHFWFLHVSLVNSGFLYQANFASRIDGASPFLGGVRAQPLLIHNLKPSAGQCADLATSGVEITREQPLTKTGVRNRCNRPGLF
jgi:hypothetical protein